MKIKNDWWLYNAVLWILIWLFNFVGGIIYKTGIPAGFGIDSLVSIVNSTVLSIVAGETVLKGDNNISYFIFFLIVFGLFKRNKISFWTAFILALYKSVVDLFLLGKYLLGGSWLIISIDFLVMFFLCMLWRQIRKEKN